MSDHEVLLQIQEWLDGTAWTVDMLDEIARLLDDNGYRIHDIDGRPYEVADGGRAA